MLCNVMFARRLLGLCEVTFARVMLADPMLADRARDRLLSCSSLTKCC